MTWLCANDVSPEVLAELLNEIDRQCEIRPMIANAAEVKRLDNKKQSQNELNKISQRHKRSKY